MPTDVLDLVEHWSAAERRNDAAAVGEVLDGAFTGVGPFGFVLNRDQWLARFDNGLTNSAFAVVEPQVRQFGTTAIVIGVLNQQTTFRDQDSSGRYRITIVANRSSAGWLLAGVHIGPLADAAGGAPAL